MPFKSWRIIGALGALALVLVACSQTDDDVTAPFFESASLEQVECVNATLGFECLRLDTEVIDHKGSATATCRVYALARDGSTDLGEVAHFEGFAISSGNSPTFELLVPSDKPDGFMRWQPECSPGPPG